MNKVVLVLVDGMRPDGLTLCGNAYTEELLSRCAYTLSAHTVMPSVTLPCHMSLFHSVDPERHGIVTNTFTPQVRPVAGLDHQLNAAGLKCAHFITWEELRDISRPNELAYCAFINQHKDVDTDIKITDAALSYIAQEDPDFTFIYLGETDEVGGHDCGWMSEQYMRSVSKAVDCIKRIDAATRDTHTLIVTADHGGHGRSHGENIPEDMTIPLLIRGERFPAGAMAGDISIKDIAPTIVSLLGAQCAREWEGKSLIP